jgi:hypothetical protein
MSTTRIRTIAGTIAGTSLVAAAIGLAALGTAGTASADSGCVNYAGFSTCWDD